MTEAKLTGDVLARLRLLFKGFSATYGPAIVRKINDRITGGIPDAYVAVNGVQTWLEFKRRPTFRTKLTFTPTQRQSLPQLYFATRGRVFIVVATLDDGSWDIYPGNTDFTATAPNAALYHCADRADLIDTLRELTSRAF